MSPYRRTRIVATVGPASRELAILQSLLEAGVNMVRLNMSHGTHGTCGETREFEAGDLFQVASGT